jgi:hypothetical protein
LSYQRQIVFFAIAIVCPFPLEANSGPVSHALEAVHCPPQRCTTIVECGRAI